MRIQALGVSPARRGDLGDSLIVSGVTGQPSAILHPLADQTVVLFAASITAVRTEIEVAPIESDNSLTAGLVFAVLRWFRCEFRHVRTSLMNC